MALILRLHTENDSLVVQCEGQALGAPVKLAELPDLQAVQALPYDAGLKLTEALGGAALLARLGADPEGLLLLDCADAQADRLPWEFAALPGRQLLALRYGLLRLVERDSPPPPQGEAALRFLALAADPLVDDKGQPFKQRLDFDPELRALRRALAESGAALEARRLPPTAAELRRALRRGLGPVILNLTCHGNILETEVGPMAVLLLEDEDGGMQLLRGVELAGMAASGALRLVVLNSCLTAAGADEARLARALVFNGLPAAIGMQGNFPAALVDEWAGAFYESLFSGQPLGHALRLARQELLAAHPGSAGLPVGYAARSAWGALPLAAGRPILEDLRLPGRCGLPQEVQPPRPLLGRDAALHDLARVYSQGGRVSTIAGPGGVGKTALAAGFAERFAWRWPAGVHGVSFASGAVEAAIFRQALLRILRGAEGAKLFESAPPEQQAQAILEALPLWDGLLLLDNYETVLQGALAEEAQAVAVQRLAHQMAEGGARLLLTSREQPAGLPGERLYPPQRLLAGLEEDPAAALFLRHSARAGREGQAGRALARAAAQAAEGHPLAIALLAGQYDASPELSPRAFLERWPQELAAARRGGLAGHHVTFAVAFARSFDALGEERQAFLSALALFEVPFLIAGAAFAWRALHEPGDDLPEEAGEAALEDASELLGELARRSLLEVYSTGDDNTPGAYRFQPALRQEAARCLAEAARPAAERGYAAYGAWLASYGYNMIHKSPAVAQLVRQSLPALRAALPLVQGVERLWHIRRLAWLLTAYGQTGEAFELLTGALPEGAPLPDPAVDAEAAKAYSSLLYELAGSYINRGDLGRALELYQQSLAIDEQVGDLQGKGATLHQMAQVYLTRGDLGRALELYQQSLEIREQVGDLQGKGATLHNMAQVYLTRGDLGRALELYQQTLGILEQVGDLKGKGATLHNMAQVYLTRGDLGRALELYQQTLGILEQVGDLKGKGATLANMAQVYLTRGDLGRALELYQQSLAIDEQVGDLKGKGATLHNMAQVYLTRGDLGRALELYQQTLGILEQVGDLKGKGATLHNMAQVYLTRGDLGRALELYQQSLEIREQVGDLQGKGATLHNMAQVYLTRGDLGRALELYQQSLEIREQVGDLQGKGATLANMAQVYLTRGDLGRALELYQQSLEIREQVGDLKGKGATLHNMAQVYLTRGDLGRALELYQQSLAIKEQVGDLQGKGATLSQLSNVFAGQGDWARAEDYARQALQVAQSLGELQGIAFRTAKLGQIAQQRGDNAQAVTLYREGLALFERLGAEREITQVQGLIAGLEGGGAPAATDDPLAQALGRARAAAQAGEHAAAAQAQEEAIALLRAALEAAPPGEPTRQLQITLSVSLFNLAGFYARLERHAEAVQALEEVVALDERTGHPDLESDRQALENARRMAQLSPAEREQLQQAARREQEQAQSVQQQAAEELERLTPEERAQLEEAARRFAALSPEEQQALRIQALLEQVDQAVEAASRGQADADDLAAQFTQVAAQAAAGEVPGSSWDQAARYLRAAAALLAGQPLPPIPAAYAERWAALQSRNSIFPKN